MIRAPTPDPDTPAALAGLELLATAVLLLDGDARVQWANPAAENLFELSRRRLVGLAPVQAMVGGAALALAIDRAVASGASYTEQALEL